MNGSWEQFLSMSVFLSGLWLSQLSYPVVVTDWCPRWRLIQSQPFADVTMLLKRWNTPKDASTLPVRVEQELPINNSLNIRLSSDVIPILVHRVNFLQWHFHSGVFVGVSESPLSPPSLPPSVCRQPLDVLLLREEETLVNVCLWWCVILQSSPALLNPRVRDAGMVPALSRPVFGIPSPWAQTPCADRHSPRFVLSPGLEQLHSLPPLPH